MAHEPGPASSNSPRGNSTHCVRVRASAAHAKQDQEVDTIIPGHLERGEPQDSELFVRRKDCREEMLCEAEEGEAEGEPKVIPMVR